MVAPFQGVGLRANPRTPGPFAPFEKALRRLTLADSVDHQLDIFGVRIRRDAVA